MMDRETIIKQARLELARRDFFCFCMAKAKTILYDRYLAGMSWREIEEKRGFTRQWLARMRDRAIRMISQNTS